MTPVLNAESHARVSRSMLERRDDLAKENRYRLGRPMEEPFVEGHEAMPPLPRTPFDAAERKEHKADQGGEPPPWDRSGIWWPLMARPDPGRGTVRVQRRDPNAGRQEGRRDAARLRGPASTVRDPASSPPALMRRIQAWGIPHTCELPEKLRLTIDAQYPAHRRRAFGLISGASGASGFKTAASTADHIIGQGRELDETGLRALAGRLGRRPARPGPACLRRVHDAGRAAFREGGAR